MSLKLQYGFRWLTLTPPWKKQHQQILPMMKQLRDHTYANNTNLSKMVTRLSWCIAVQYNTRIKLFFSFFFLFSIFLPIIDMLRAPSSQTNCRLSRWKTCHSSQQNQRLTVSSTNAARWRTLNSSKKSKCESFGLRNVSFLKARYIELRICTHATIVCQPS